MRLTRKSIKDEIITEITTMILQGTLHRGDFLPSIRNMSKRYQVSRGTVMLVYKHLESMGYIQGYERSGYIVTGKITAQRGIPTSETSDDAKQHEHSLPLASQQFQRLVDRQPCLIPLHFVKRCIWKQERSSTKRNTFPTDNLLRFLMISRGISPEPQQLLLFPGRQEALMLIAFFMLRQQTKPVVILEQPCDGKIQQLFEYLAFTIISIPVDHQGLLVDRLPPIQQALVVCMPSLQFPTATQLSLERRQQLTEWAEKYQGIVVEDDSYSMLGFGQSKSLPLLNSSTNCTYFYLTQLHELTGANHNLSLLIAPKNLLTKLCSLYYVTQSTALPNSYELINAFLGSSYFMKYLTTLLDERREKSLVAIQGIRGSLHPFQLSAPPASGFCYFTLPRGKIPEKFINQYFFAYCPSVPTVGIETEDFLYPFALLSLQEITKINHELVLLLTPTESLATKNSPKKSPHY